MTETTPPRDDRQRGTATWTLDREYGLWYVALDGRHPPPYLRQIHVEAIIDVAADGTVAGIEIIDGKMPLAPLLDPTVR